MACQKPNTTLSDAELKTYLEATSLETVTSNDLSEQMNQPMFKVKSSLRELMKNGYVKECEDFTYAITPEGEKLLLTLSVD